MDRYLLEEFSGYAGFHAVYRATDQETGETVAAAVPRDLDAGADRRPGLPWDDLADMKMARAFVAVEMFGLKTTTRLVHMLWSPRVLPGVPGYIGKKVRRRDPPRGEHFKASTKRALLEAAGHRCEECGSAEELQIDHIEPVFLGGEGAFENGRVLCRSCHQTKTNTDRKDSYW